MLSTLARGLLVVVVGWAALVVLAAVFQRQLIYLPDRRAPDPPPDVEEVALTTDDGLELTAWHLGPDGDEPPVTTVLVAPGNAGNRELRLPLARGLAARGHAVLLLDYRGYGGNPGRPSEDGLAADARAARDALLARDEVDAERLAYLGESLGTGVIAALAADDAPGPPPVAVVLRSPFRELAEVGASAMPILPVRTLLRDRYPVLDDLADVEVPVLVVAGERDRVVPTDQSLAVADELDAALVTVPGADHNDRVLLDGDRYLDAVDEHLRRAVDQRRDGT